MTAFIPSGNNVTQRIIFNSGYIDFGSNRIVQVDNVNLELSWTIVGLYTLGSIKPQDLVRHTQKVLMSGKLKSWPAELVQYAGGSSTNGTPNEIDTLDGQPTLQNPVVTFFDRNNKEIQYQLSGALFKSNKLSAKAEDFAEFDFELEAKDITAIDYTS